MEVVSFGVHVRLKRIGIGPVAGDDTAAVVVFRVLRDTTAQQVGQIGGIDASTLLEIEHETEGEALITEGVGQGEFVVRVRVTDDAGDRIVDVHTRRRRDERGAVLGPGDLFADQDTVRLADPQAGPRRIEVTADVEFIHAFGQGKDLGVVLREDRINAPAEVLGHDRIDVQSEFDTAVADGTEVGYITVVAGGRGHGHGTDLVVGDPVVEGAVESDAAVEELEFRTGLELGGEFRLEVLIVEGGREFHEGLSHVRGARDEGAVVVVRGGVVTDLGPAGAHLAEVQEAVLDPQGLGKHHGCGDGGIEETVVGDREGRGHVVTAGQVEERPVLVVEEDIGEDTPLAGAGISLAGRLGLRVVDGVDAAVDDFGAVGRETRRGLLIVVVTEGYPEVEVLHEVLFGRQEQGRFEHGIIVDTLADVALAAVTAGPQVDDVLAVLGIVVVTEGIVEGKPVREFVAGIEIGYRTLLLRGDLVILPSPVRVVRL